MPTKFIDVDWNKCDLGTAEWENKQRRRYIQRLDHYQRTRQGAGQSPASGAREAATERLAARPPSSVRVPTAKSSGSGCQGRFSSEGHPRTPSTSLTTLWRRCLSSPDGLRPTSSALSAMTPTARERVLQRLQSSEAWFTACEKMGKEELLDLVEHVHGKIVDERRRRKQAESHLLDMGGG
mmetsp:Transcript_6050/g.11015  ORF Transcript_6050/g.11015 Transcript_6050/m.11015 type:complete len:181 (-) Transcript_6050:236-778(-)